VIHNKGARTLGKRCEATSYRHVKVFYRIKPFALLANVGWDKVLIAENPPKLFPNTNNGNLSLYAS
jgi:hypothetical protein